MAYLALAGLGKGPDQVCPAIFVPADALGKAQKIGMDASLPDRFDDGPQRHQTDHVGLRNKRHWHR